MAVADSGPVAGLIVVGVGLHSCFPGALIGRHVDLDVSESQEHRLVVLVEEIFAVG
jgi:hypothetical protein